MPDGRLWLIRDTYAAQTAWAPRHVGKELRLARLGAADAELGAIRADAEAAIARKVGDRDRAERHDELAASYRTLHDLYQHREQALTQAMADRHEWEHATEPSRRLAIAADAELCRRYPDHQLEPLRSAEPALTTAASEQLHVAQAHKAGKTPAWIRDLTAQHRAFRARLDEYLRLTGLDRADQTEAFPAWQTPWQDAILQPPKPEIIPSPRIPQRAAEYDTEPEAAG